MSSIFVLTSILCHFDQLFKYVEIEQMEKDKTMEKDPKHEQVCLSYVYTYV